MSALLEAPAASPFPSTAPHTAALFARADAVIPGGIYGHVSPAAAVPLAGPYYAARAEGARYWDVDGRSFIDFMCAYGPIVLGYRHPEVEAAVDEQRARGDAFNHPTERSVELAERLVALIDFADWAVMAKNGGDMTTWAIRVAREHTKRPKILKIKGAYHGVDPWCAQSPGGVIASDVAHVHDFPWNDPQAFLDLTRQHAGQVAGVIVTPYHHPVFADQAEPDPTFVATLNEACQREGIVLIVDDIRSGFRLDVHGSHGRFGWQPDLACYCKALGNGYPVSATVGTSALRVAASKVFLTGSYWNGAAGLTAALKTLEILERDDVPAQLEQTGRRLCEGLQTLGKKHSIPLKASGPGCAPFVRVANETHFRRQQAWTVRAMQPGADNLAAFFHPHHNWFVCAAHTNAEIDCALAIADRALAEVAQR